jgi:hypothetical protein
MSVLKVHLLCYTINGSQNAYQSKAFATGYWLRHLEYEAASNLSPFLHLHVAIQLHDPVLLPLIDYWLVYICLLVTLKSHSLGRLQGRSQISSS